RHCPQGHEVSPFANYCNLCGAQVAPPVPGVPGGAVVIPTPSRRWKRLMLGVVAVGVVLALLAGAYVRPVLPMRATPVVRSAISMARQDPRVVAVLGAPVNTRWSVRGYESRDETGWTETRAWIPLYGTKGDGTVYARAGMASGPWVFTSLEFRPQHGP